MKGHCFSSQEASSLQACPSLHVCVWGGQCHRPREGVTPGRKMGRKLLGNSACSQEELGHQALALFYLNMAFLRSNLAGSEAALACVSLCPQGWWRAPFLDKPFHSRGLEAKDSW